MAGRPVSEEQAARFAIEGSSAGLVVPPTIRWDPALAAGVIALVVLASATVGYATDWVNLHRPYGSPLSEVPGCPPGGVALTLPTEANESAGLATVWPQLASGFSTSTGGCLTVVGGPAANGFALLAGGSAAGLVGPELPGSAGASDLSTRTTAVPLFVAPLVVIVNVDGLPAQLNLSAGALAGAYLGSATTWLAPVFTIGNPGLSAPLDVTVVHFDGPDEANAVLSTYLAQGNASFRADLAPGPNVSWPVGPGVASPAAMVAAVATTPGSIGYEPSDVCPSLPAEVVCAAVQAGPGAYVYPTPEAVEAAAALEANSTAVAEGDWANVTGVSLGNGSVYPMTETTYAVLYRDLGTAYGGALSLTASKWLITLLFWVASDAGGVPGQTLASAGYLPLLGAFATASEEVDLGVTYLGSWIVLPPGSLPGGDGEGGEGGGETGEF